ncbi:UDP-N-acetylmuramate dehydrogenase [Sediminibacterium ginsengisoli]|uniref:UDP-N-acetylenolpyruvoylglucosamine reductase n=1 Tax=Sediminibacterium ginsengisoli TaxID=413434 RepID=A0A1T4L451_9BACT|nr:UDP-N-acetylmuramate dehydrogenase [Sediminibacterium ginsengisoli]SJZ49484.1 UDP-N-acetylmuramate dehydrogenase [Sediminibacterium ginsengisoli]
MTLQQNISLRPFNSFGIDVRASHFAAFSSADELEQLLALPGLPAPFILGGGSNILFTNDVQRLVLKNELKGTEIIRETESEVYVRVQAGENWHAFVSYCVNKGLGGIENLSLIPGNAGASPMQNIGAYGVEIKDVFHQLEAWHIRDQCIVTFSAADCAFGYRESVFKNRYKNQFVILNVTFRLSRKPVFNTSYGAIEAELEKMGVQELSVRNISQAVINIRSSKLPDPKETGNAGSFFKNPVIEPSLFEQLKTEYPGIPGYPGAAGHVKVAAGWLIEQCGWKGYRRGDAGCYPKQALVLVNYGNASGAEIYALSQEIIDSVHKQFGIVLEREVNIIT